MLEYQTSANACRVWWKLAEIAQKVRLHVRVDGSWPGQVSKKNQIACRVDGPEGDSQDEFQDNDNHVALATLDAKSFESQKYVSYCSYLFIF